LDFSLNLGLDYFHLPGGLRWWLRNENRQFFPAYVDTFMSVYNPGGILGTTICRRQYDDLLSNMINFDKL